MIALYVVATLANVTPAEISPGTVCTFSAALPHETAPERLRVVVLTLAPTADARPGAWVQPIGRGWPGVQWHVVLERLRECVR